MKIPLVSISVVTYNHEAFIKTCLDSILSQRTSFDFEILIGEDNSSDDTREICKEYSNQYPEKIKLFLHDRDNVIKINGRPTGRFNFMNNIKNARGKYIAICEGDDYWTDPYKLQKQIDYLDANPDVSICFHRVNLLKEGEVELHKLPSQSLGVKFNYIELLESYNFIATCSVVFKKPLGFKFPDFFSSIPFGDLALYKILSRDKKLYCLNENMGVYRIHSGGIWSGINEIQSISD